MKALVELAEENSNVMLLTGDLGYSVFEDFEESFPDQYINVGVAEQNMTGIAAGLALEGKIVFTYSIGNFPTLRCLEQIRNNLCYHELNVNIIGMGAGFSYGALGMTHHATEDISVMRSLPNTSVVAPSGPEEAYELVKQVAKIDGVSYIRLDKTSLDFPGRSDIKFGAIRELIAGFDIAILATGGITKNAINIAKKAIDKGVSVGIYSVHTIKPLDKIEIINICNNYKGLISVEENNRYGGLSSGVCEVIAENNLSIYYKGMYINDMYVAIVGDQDYLRRYSKLSEEDILKNVMLLNDLIKKNDNEIF